MADRVLLGHVAYDEISSRLRDGRFRAGTKLNEKDLARDLGMSKTPIREALRRLEAEGLVESISNVGHLVTRLTYRDIREAFEARAALEGAAARLATERASAQAVDELIHEFHSFTLDPKLDQADTLLEMRRVNNIVHGTLLRIADNDLIKRTLAGIDMRVSRAIAEYVQDDYDRYAQSYKQHVAIVDAFERRDAEECERAVKTHITSVASHILERYR